MTRINIAGKVIGDVWRVHETDKEIICFMLKNEPAWFRIKYNREIALGRADYMVEMLQVAAQKDNDIEVALEYELSFEQKSPLFHDVKYIQIRVRPRPTIQPVETETRRQGSSAVAAHFRK